MHVEAISPVEQGLETSSPPTTLHLFRYKGSERENLQVRVSTALQLEENFSRTALSLDKLYAARNTRLERLFQTDRELSESIENSTSSISCGAVYLKMRSELPNLSPNDFMEFFKLSAKFNTLFTEQINNSVSTRGEQIALLQSLSRMNSRRLPTEYEKTLDAIIPNPPAWFKDNKKAWKIFFMFRANFTVYLNADAIKDLATRRSSIVKNALVQLGEDSYGITKQGEFPDWLLEGSSMLPTKEEVEKELAEDKEQETKTISAREKIKEQKGYLITAFIDKTQKAVARLSDLAGEAFPNIQNFADIVLFLEIAKKAHRFRATFEEIIREDAQSYDILKISEPIALYIEKKLLSGKILQSTQDPIDADFTDLFTGFLASVKDKEGSSANQFRDLKKTNKKAFEALNYDLKPYLEILPADEISLLEDLLAESKDKPIELFIWDMAGLISSRINREEIQLSRSQLGALHYLSKFTDSFLRNHSEWVYKQLQEGLAGKNQEPAPANIAAMSDVQKEIEHITEALAQGNLAGWHIFYTDNKTADPNHLSKIEGKSLEEREEALQEYLHYNDISSSIKTGSIIRALEWIAGVPQEIEQVRMTKEIAGEVFKKVKRGNLRIFYILDAAQKKIIFFTHQKKDWSYGF